MVGGPDPPQDPPLRLTAQPSQPLRAKHPAQPDACPCYSTTLSSRNFALLFHLGMNYCHDGQRRDPPTPICTRDRESRQDSGHRDPFMVQWFTVQCYSYLVGYRHCDNYKGCSYMH